MATAQANIEFVQEIEKHPCLYNNKLPNYMRKDITDRTWAEIGNKFQLTGPEAKEKWKNLRSVFVRHLKPFRSGSATAHKKPYYLADFMHFAIPFIKTAGVPSENLKETSNATSFDDDITELQSSELWEQTQSKESRPTDISTSISQQQLSLPFANSHSILVQQSFLPSTSAQSTMQLKPAPSLPSQAQLAKIIRKKRKQAVVTQVKRDISAYFKWKQSNMTDDCGSTENSNKMFLLSLIPDMNKMNDNQTRLFKRKVLELVDNIFDQSSEIVNSPNTFLSTPSPCADERPIKEESFEE